MQASLYFRLTVYIFSDKQEEPFADAGQKNMFQNLPKIPGKHLCHTLLKKIGDASTTFSPDTLNPRFNGRTLLWKWNVALIVLTWLLQQNSTLMIKPYLKIRFDRNIPLWK